MELTNSISDFNFDNNVVGKGKHFVSRFIEPGAVSYGKAGVLKVTKEALDKFSQSFVGCPVIIKHKDLTNANVDEERVGVVNGVWYDAGDGWFYCDGVIWNKEAIKKIENGWSVSCTYDMTESTGENGEWPNIEYDDELVNGVYQHLAIVPNPRYEDATIKLNSKEGKDSMLFKMFNGKKVQNSDKEKTDMMENEKSVDKNALKNKLLEHINKAVKGKGEIDGQSEDAWYEELNSLLDKLSYSDSEAEKSNSDDDEKEEDKKDEEKENKCNKNAESDEKGDDEESDAEDKENRKKNSKEFDELKRLHNSGDTELKSAYVNEKDRIELGKSLF